MKTSAMKLTAILLLLAITLALSACYSETFNGHGRLYCAFAAESDCTPKGFDTWAGYYNYERGQCSMGSVDACNVVGTHEQNEKIDKDIDDAIGL